MKYATALLVASAQAAFPAYTTPLTSATAIEMQSEGDSAFSCLRNNLLFVYKYADSPAYSTTDPTTVGTITQDASNVALATDTQACCEVSAAGITACPDFIDN